MRRFSFFLATILLLIPTLASAQLKAVATTGDLAAITKAVGGDAVQVQSLVRPGEDPHFVDPRPSYARHLNQADLLVYVGMELEVGWLPALLRQARNPKIQPGQTGNFDASRQVQALQVPTGPVDRSMGDVHPAGNPHYTTDPRQAARVALALGQTLGQLDPANADQYQTRARDFARQALEKARQWEERFAELPASSRRMITYHSSWAYIADWLSIEDVAQLEPKPGVAPGPRHVAHVAELVEQQKIKALLQLDYYPRTIAQNLARRTGLTLVVAPAQTRDNQSYFEHIDAIVSPLFDALK